MCICSDIIFVAEDARIGFPSLPAGAGYVSAFWNWMVGPHRTKYLAFVPGSQRTGKEAEAMGFATRAFPAERLEEETYGYARHVAFGDGTVPIRWLDLHSGEEKHLVRIRTLPDFTGKQNELRVDPHPA